MEPLSNIDVIILVCIAISMLIAFIRGFVKEVLSVLGMIIFVVLTIYLTPLLLPFMSKYIASKLLAQFVIFLLIMAVFYAIWIISTDKLIARIRTSTLSFMDRLFGLLFGFLRALLILGFCFLVIKIVLPEELEKGALKESKFLPMAKSCSDIIEKLLPQQFIEETVKSVEDMNKAEKKSTEKTDDKNKSSADKKKEDTNKGLPTKLDQEQMDKMFELLVKPEVKNDKVSTTNKTGKNNTEKKGYDNKETNSLDRLIDITTK